MSDVWDVIVVGAGTAGLPTAIFAARRGGRVLVIEAAPEVGGTLFLSKGRMSAAGSRLQAAKGIADSADEHCDEVMRISKNTADPMLVRLAVDNAADTVDWLMDNHFEAEPDHPVFVDTHEPYSVARLFWGKDDGLSVLEALRPPFEAEVEAGGITLLLESEVTELTTDGGGIAGVVVRGPDGNLDEHKGRNIVLTCGGYASNPKMFRDINGYPQYVDGASLYSQGAGIRLGISAGGWIRGAENYYCAFGSVLENDSFPAKVTASPNHWPERRQPWELYVNAAGARFVAEDNPSVDAREHAVLEQTDLRYWIIFDQTIADAAPPLFVEGTKEDMFRYFESHPMYFKAASLTALAEAAGIRPKGLCKTIAAYNEALDGEDPLGRVHRPLPVAVPPFYAVRVQGASFTSIAGLAVDENLCVIDTENRPVANLYAAGELLGAGQTMGAGAMGGMMVTPALTFGRLLGDRILQWTKKAAAAG